MNFSDFCTPSMSDVVLDQLIKLVGGELANVPDLERTKIIVGLIHQLQLKHDSLLRKYKEETPNHLAPASSAICWENDGEITASDPSTRYFVKRKIGQGGFSEVFLATDTLLQRDVALKVLLADAASDEEIKTRFLAEIVQTAQLEHSNIVRIYGLGEDSSRLYAVMEFIDGADLREAVISVRQFNLAVIRNIYIQIASALLFLHKRGFIHCDLKPENILISKDGIAKLIDFNLMISKDALQSEFRRGILGTPAYIAPEMIEERAFDERADIYSLGVMFYEMRTGHTPFEGTINEVLHHHLLTTPKPPSRRAAGILPQEDQIILKCMAKNPQDRYGSLADLINDIKNLEVLERAGARISSTIPCSIAPAGACDKTLETQRSLIPLINSSGTKANILFEENAGIAVKSSGFEPVRLGRGIESLDDLCKYCQLLSSARAVIANLNSFSPEIALQIGMAYGAKKRTLLVKGQCIDSSCFLEMVFPIHSYDTDRNLAKLISQFIRSHDEDISKSAACFFRWPYHCKKYPQTKRKNILFIAVPPADEKEQMLLQQAVLPALSQMGFDPECMPFESRMAITSQTLYNDLCSICRGALTASSVILDISEWNHFIAFALGIFIASKKKLLLIRRSGKTPHPAISQLSQYELAFFKDIIDAVHENIL